MGPDQRLPAVISNLRDLEEKLGIPEAERIDFKAHTP